MASFDSDVVTIGSGFGQRRRPAGGGEGLPGRRHGVRQAVEGLGHPEEPVASAGFPVVPRGGAVQNPTHRRAALATPLRLPLPVAGYGGPD